MLYESDGAALRHNQVITSSPGLVDVQPRPGRLSDAILRLVGGLVVIHIM